MSSSDRPRTYRLEPRDTSGVFLGLTTIQCALLGSSLVLAVIAISAGVPLLVAAVPVGVAAAASFARFGGYVLWEWLPLGLGWAWRRCIWGQRWEAPLPLWPPTGAAEAPPLPACLDGLDLINVPGGDDSGLGCVRDRDRNTLTAVVAVEAAPFIVESPDEQERLLAGWGDVLGQCASDRAVSHVSWSDLARPSSLGEHVQWLPSAGGDVNTEAAVSYRELLDLAATTATAHDVAVSITVSRDRLPRRHDPADPAEERLARALVASVEALRRGLQSAGLGTPTPLDVPGLRRMLRLRIDPTADRPRRTNGRLADRLGLVTTQSCGPLILEAEWRHLRIDAAWHRTYWVASWPRLAVPPSWLEPFLSNSATTRTVTVVLMPVSRYQSKRRIERDLVKLQSDADTKEEKGRRVDAQHRRATETLLEREQELIAGFVEMQYVGLVTVTGATGQELDDQAEITEQLAREAGMELRALDGRHDIAWAASLPFGLAPGTLLAA